jgi:hypothetical protein
MDPSAGSEQARPWVSGVDYAPMGKPAGYVWTDPSNGTRWLRVDDDKWSKWKELT